MGGSAGGVRGDGVAGLNVSPLQRSGTGMSLATPVRVRRVGDGKFKARCGIAIFGSTNMSEVELEACDHNPFHEDFYDDFVEGDGLTEDDAMTALNADMRRKADRLWASLIPNALRSEGDLNEI